MCDPVTIALTTASTGISLMANHAAGKANAAIAKANQANLLIAADDAKKRGATEAGKKRLEGRQLTGTQRAAYGASGVRVDTGSAADVVYGSAGMIEADALTIISNAEKESVNLQNQAAGVGMQSELDQRASLMNDVGTVLGAGNNLWSKRTPQT